MTGEAEVEDSIEEADSINKAIVYFARSVIVQDMLSRAVITYLINSMSHLMLPPPFILFNYQHLHPLVINLKPFLQHQHPHNERGILILVLVTMLQLNQLISFKLQRIKQGLIISL
ncbi:uncharacterized protein DS421_18g621140 [Arachis hypogaea]|nr:uncharacterized protein DS421_18g621140 [Arachis hypogaea]